MSEKWKVKKADGSIYGPADTDAMRKWIKEDRVLADDSISPEDKENWREAKSLPEFADLFEIKTSLEKEKSAEKEKSPLVSKRETQNCPFCGEEILVIARKCKHCGEFLDGTLHPVSDTTQRKMPSGPEKKIWESHPSSLYYLGYWIWGIILFLFWGIGLIFGPSTTPGACAISLFFYVFPFCGGPIIYAILDQKTRTFTHTSRRVMAKVGIIARKTHEVEIRDIRGINMKQGLVERLFGLGTVGVGSASTAGLEVVFKGIPNPAKVRDEIRRAKYEIDE